MLAGPIHAGWIEVAQATGGLMKTGTGTASNTTALTSNSFDHENAKGRKREKRREAPQNSHPSRFRDFAFSRQRRSRFRS